MSKKYSIEEIYELVGKEDKVAGIIFRVNSSAFKVYGGFITVVCIYTQKEREQLDEMVKTESVTSGNVRAKYLLDELTSDITEKLLSEGFSSEDVFDIIRFEKQEINTYHSTEKRKIKKIIIPLEAQPKGKDIEWMYGAKKMYLRSGIGLSPEEVTFYLACKYYFEKEKLTEFEQSSIFQKDGEMNELVEYQLLRIKSEREEISDDELIRANVLYTQKEGAAKRLLDKYLVEAGSSLKKLVVSGGSEIAAELMYKILYFIERRFTVNEKVPIYLDIDGYLHVYMRHTEEMKVTDHFEDKTNFQWDESDVFMVMEKIIGEIRKEFQDFVINNPDKRYSRYGDKSVYFQGDYYTLHIESNGRISTFHKNRKENLG